MLLSVEDCTLGRYNVSMVNLPTDQMSLVQFRAGPFYTTSH